MIYRRGGVTPPRQLNLLFLFSNFGQKLTGGEDGGLNNEQALFGFLNFDRIDTAQPSSCFFKVFQCQVFSNIYFFHKKSPLSRGFELINVLDSRSGLEWQSGTLPYPAESGVHGMGMMVKFDKNRIHIGLIILFFFRFVLIHVFAWRRTHQSRFRRETETAAHKVTKRKLITYNNGDPLWNVFLCVAVTVWGVAKGEGYDSIG